MTVKAYQGTDTNVLTAGSVSGTGSVLCTTSNGGATTSCPPGTYQAGFSLTANTPFTVNHNLGTTAIDVSFVDGANNNIKLPWTITDGNNIVIASTVNQSGTITILARGVGSGGGGGLLLQTNGVNNGNQSKLNLVAGTGATLTDSGTGNITITATGGSGVTSGTLAARPACGVATVGLYFAIDQPQGQQIYTCSNTTGTYLWVQVVQLGGSGALAFTSGVLDIVTAVVPRLAAGNAFTGANTFARIGSGSASNTDLVGELSFSAATTASYSWTGSYTSHPECTVEPQFDFGSTHRHWITYTSTTSFTINFDSAQTGSVSYHCTARN
jgi:hypothetical protein